MSIEILFSYLTTGHTTTTGVFSVLPNAAVTSADVATVLACLAEASRHRDGVDEEEVMSNSVLKVYRMCSTEVGTSYLSIGSGGWGIRLI